MKCLNYERFFGKNVRVFFLCSPMRENVRKRAAALLANCRARRRRALFRLRVDWRRQLAWWRRRRHLAEWRARLLVADRCGDERRFLCGRRHFARQLAQHLLELRLRHFGLLMILVVARLDGRRNAELIVRLLDRHLVVVVVIVIVALLDSSRQCDLVRLIRLFLVVVVLIGVGIIR